MQRILGTMVEYISKKIQNRIFFEISCSNRNIVKVFLHSTSIKAIPLHIHFHTDVKLLSIGILLVQIAFGYQFLKWFILSRWLDSEIFVNASTNFR